MQSGNTDYYTWEWKDGIRRLVEHKETSPSCKCSYCGCTNDHIYGTCDYCGAPLEG